MREWLETYDVTQKRYVYGKRIQKRIEKELNALLWLSMKYPSVFLYEAERKDYRQMRLRKLMGVICALEGRHVEVELTKPIEKNQDRRCVSCGLKQSRIGTNHLCYICNQKKIFKSLKAKEGKTA